MGIQVGMTKIHTYSLPQNWKSVFITIYLIRVDVSCTCNPNPNYSLEKLLVGIGYLFLIRWLTVIPLLVLLGSVGQEFYRSLSEIKVFIHSHWTTSFECTPLNLIAYFKYYFCFWSWERGPEEELHMALLDMDMQNFCHQTALFLIYTCYLLRLLELSRWRFTLVALAFSSIVSQKY